jgi:poly(A) polymerase
VTGPLARLRSEGIPFVLCTYSSLDRYFGVRQAGPLYLATDSSIVSLARTFDGLEFPGLPLQDAVAREDGERLVFQCVDSLAEPLAVPFGVMTLLFDPARGAFLDRAGIYPELRAPGLTFRADGQPRWLGLCEAARLVSRYHYVAEGAFGWAPALELPPIEYQRELLSALLDSAFPPKGLALLEQAGFVQAAWPELAKMAAVPHAKDYHPEGNVWQHTMATFEHRKRPDRVLSLGLLLHDSGKPDAEATGERRFDGHAEIGARIASRFLARLGYDPSVVSDVEFLVRYHMMPAALKSLPPFRTDPILASPQFPRLLELYRADLCSSWRDEEGYYEACRLYRAWSKRRGNPYRDIVERKRAAARRRT